MALENEAPNLGGNGIPATPALDPQPEVSGGPNVPAAAPAVGQPAAQPAPVQPVQVAPSGSFFKALAHSLAGGVLATTAGLAGPAPSDYTIDASGKQTATPRPDTTRTKLQRIAEAALVGLSAGAQAPRRPGAEALSGFGAGFTAQQQQAQQEDLLKRQQERQSFEQQQKALMDKAVRASHNASTFSLWQKAMVERNDHDPERQRNLQIQAAAEDWISKNPGTSMQVSVISDAEASAMREQDAHSVAKHAFFPLGMREVSQDGTPIFQADGVTPKQEGQILMISGGTNDGKIPIPQAVVSDLKKYGKIAGISGADRLAEGTEVPLPQFLAMTKRIADAKIKEMDGWKEKTVGENAVIKDGKKVQQNTVSGEVREYAGLPVATNLKSAQTRKENAEAALAEAKAKKEGDGTSNLIGEDYLKTLPVSRQATIRAIGEGRQVLSAGMLRTKDGQALAKDVNQAYPTYDASKSESYFKLRKEFDSGKVAAGINSFNTVLTHISRMFDHVSAWGTIPGVSGVARAFGNKSAAALRTDRSAVSTELAKAYANGQISEGEVKDWESKLDSSSPKELRNNLIEVANLLNGKLDAYQNQWDQGMPSSVIPPRQIISTVAKAAYNHVTGVKDQANPGQPQTQPQAQNVPAGATGKAPGSDGKMHYHDAQGKDLGVTQ